MNTPVEFDIYAHANSTLVGGTRMINGLGGSGDYLRNGYLKIMHSPSTRPSKTDPLGITCVVPKAPHIDHTEHDLDVLVTEQGLAAPLLADVLYHVVIGSASLLYANAHSAEKLSAIKPVIGPPIVAASG